MSEQTGTTADEQPDTVKWMKFYTIITVLVLVGIGWMAFGQYQQGNWSMTQVVTLLVFSIIVTFVPLLIAEWWRRTTDFSESLDETTLLK